MSHRANVLGRGYQDSHLDAPRLRFRRALTLGLMTLFVPGSAQLAMGRRVVGAIAMSIWVALLAALSVLAWRSAANTSATIDFLADPTTLLAVRIGLVVLAIGWLALFIDAWRLAAPRGLSWPRTALLTAVNFAVIAGVGGSAAYAAQVIGVSNEAVNQVFTGTTKSSPLQGRYNILLIGSDSGRDRTGIRPDSMTLASIDSDTGRTVLISMPRNLQNVPFPDDSPMKQAYPYGFNCGGECLLNAVYTAGSDRSDLYPDAEDPGLEATQDAVEGVTGLKVNYYLMVNLKGFRNLIDAVGGVEMDVKTRIAKFGHDDAYKNTYIEPGRQTLDGQDALWYARSRVQSDDYTRMGRQKCLMAAMLSELDPQTVLTNAISLAKAGGGLVSGNMPRTELGAFGELVLKAKNEQIISVSMVPPLVDVTNPDYDRIQRAIAKKIKRSESGDFVAPSPSASPTETTPSPTQTPDPFGSQDPNAQVSDPDDDSTTQRSANNSDDLTASC